jgi:choline dehydrogenase-like flavoprotein
MAGARHLAQFGVMVSDTSRGHIRPVAGRGLVRYDLNREDARRFQKGFEALTEIFWAAGAKEVHLPLERLPVLRGGDSSPLTNTRVAARELQLMAFHPLGTARAGADPARSVVDPDLRVHGVEGLHVADGSVVPSSLGVNPQITIMALATRLAFGLLGSEAVRTGSGRAPAETTPDLLPTGPAPARSPGPGRDSDSRRRGR